MPGPETKGARGGRLLTGVFWTGVGLAPLAALLLLIGQGGLLLRIAAVLAVLAIVLIGLSIALRRGGDSLRVEIEDVLFEEIDILRDDVRDDITTAARATHKASGEKLLMLQDTVEGLRAQVEALRAQMERAAMAPAAAHAGAHPAAEHHPGRHTNGVHNAAGNHAGGGVLRHTETVVTTRQTTLVDPDENRNGTVYGSRAVEPAPVGRRAEWSPPAPRREPEPAEESWTEQLLRDRLVQRRGDRGDRGERGDRGDRRHALEDQRDDDRITGLRASDRWASVRSDDRGHELRMGERRAAVHADESGTELHFEDRWASVRRDDGRPEHSHRDGNHRDDSRREERELRRDERREDPRRVDGRRDRDPDRDRDRDRDWDRDRDRDEPGGYWSESRWEEERAGEPGRWTETRRERRGSGHAAPSVPALTSGNAEPSSSWSQNWRSAEPRSVEPRSVEPRSVEPRSVEPRSVEPRSVEPRSVEPAPERPSRRSRHVAEDDDDHGRTDRRQEDDAPRGRGRARLADFDMSDDRWR
jgi:hypothetical protein